MKRRRLVLSFVVASVSVALFVGCSALVAYTATGSTALRVARERPRCIVVGLTPVLATARKLALVWGVIAKVFACALSDWSARRRPMAVLGYGHGA